MTVVALLHPGAMGARVGGELVARGHQVRWLPTGRSAQTLSRAADEGLTAASDVGQLVDGASVVLSVLPPQAAVEAARQVAGSGFSGTYVEANPIAPSTLRLVVEVLSGAGVGVVDAGIVGPPPRDDARTSLYLAGAADRVARVSDLFAGTRVTPVVVGAAVGQASAAKQAYALVNKGRLVLAAAAARLAETHDVRQVLEVESDRPGAQVLGELDDLVTGLAETAWRWGPEMDELAESLASAGCDASLARGLAAELRRLAEGGVRDRTATDASSGLGATCARG